jgi:DNA-binding Lrp family transcriptional regulator
MKLSSWQKHLLNNYQHAFPLVPRPFADIAQQLQVGEQEVIDALKNLQDRGAVSRVGVVFRPNAVGASTLAAMAIPWHSLEEVAALISSYVEVNHNYEREHEFNLWFVVTAEDEDKLNSVLQDMEKQSGYPVMNLPMLEDYYIDLGFDLGISSLSAENVTSITQHRHMGKPLDALDRQLVEAIQSGLPLVSRPYAEIGKLIEIAESEVIERLQTFIQNGWIKRMGVVVRHHELGYRANAMVVWDIPDEQVRILGQCMGQFEFVTLCYRRPRHLPKWPYNLFCMIHGQDRDAVLANIEFLKEQCDLNFIQHEILFSRRRFKQRGAVYRNGETQKEGASKNKNTRLNHG